MRVLLYLLLLTAPVVGEPALREIKPVPGSWTFPPLRCLEATYSGETVRLYLWDKELQVWQGRELLATHPRPGSVRYPTRDRLAGYVDPRHQSLPLLVLSDRNCTTVLAFAQGWKGALYQHSFFHGSTPKKATVLRTDVDERGMVRFTVTYSQAHQPAKTRHSVYRWNGEGFVLPR